MARSDADDKLRQGQTVTEALDRCIELAREAQGRTITGDGGAAREFALSITAMEDAQMRYARGRAKQEGRFAPADLDAA